MWIRSPRCVVIVCVGWNMKMTVTPRASVDWYAVLMTCFCDSGVDWGRATSPAGQRSASQQHKSQAHVTWFFCLSAACVLLAQQQKQQEIWTTVRDESIGAATFGISVQCATVTRFEWGTRIWYPRAAGIVFKVIAVGTPRKLVSSARYDKQQVCAYLQPFSC